MLSPHFSLEELTRSEMSVRKGIDNSPSQSVKNNLITLATNLELVRSLLNSPLHISSGYRCFALNKAIGGSDNSAHVEGYAADFTCSAFGTPKDIVNAIKKSNIQLDQCIEEGTWVHISFAPPLRNQYLKAIFVNGIAHYTPY
jgi:hypothetical protein